MRSIALRIVAAISLSAGCAVAALGQSQEYNGELRRTPRSQATDQIIVKWRPGVVGAPMQKLANAGLRLQRRQQIASDTEVLQLDRRIDHAELESMLTALRADADIAYAVSNRRRQAHLLPADPLIAEQWYFLDAQPSATRAQHAWDVTIGSAATIVAVVDTGVRFEHPDLGRVETGGKLLPGFDFIANVAVANDGDGPDADASDPGDWISATDAQAPPFDQDCVPEGANHVDSSWHGTRVSSLIGALTNNGEGMAGGSWEAVLLPVRVLGKCGGFDSDIISGMRWAAGLPVTGVPPNPHPAHIINVSLGGDGACSAAYQAAISEITSRGVLVVASVGNDAGPVSAPANCNGALGVAAIRHAGTKVGFSNLGPAATIAAPGGNCVNPAGQPCLFSIVSAVNTGLMTPAQSSYTDQLNINVGTSFSAPIVAGAAALMHSSNARLAPAQYMSLLRETARPFPVANASIPICHVPVDENDTQAECACTTQTCGAGMLDTQAAVLAAQRPFAVANVPASIAVRASVTLDGRGSFAANDRTVTAYQWSALNVTGTAPVISDAAQSLTTLQVSGSSSFTLRLTVTDDRGTQGTADLAVATLAQQAPTGSGGGGGGMDALALMLAGLLSMLLRHAHCTRRALKP